MAIGNALPLEAARPISCFRLYSTAPKACNAPREKFHQNREYIAELQCRRKPNRLPQKGRNFSLNFITSFLVVTLSLLTIF